MKLTFRQVLDILLDLELDEAMATRVLLRLEELDLLNIARRGQL